MIELLALLACAILIALTVFQVLLISGAPLGRYTQGGSHVILPTKMRIICVISIVLYVIFAMIILDDAGAIAGLDTISNGGIWILTVYFFIGTFMNAISRSKHERTAMTPVALILAFVCLFLAVN